jgi:hypothetical protein
LYHRRAAFRTENILGFHLHPQRNFPDSGLFSILFYAFLFGF